MKLVQAQSFTLNVPGPFDFKLTVRKPAGWPWATPYEVFENDTLWTATRLKDGKLVGVKLAGNGAEVVTSIYADWLSTEQTQEIAERVKLGLGFKNELEAFYALGEKDPLIKQLSNDLYGMRLGFLSGVFEMALLAISLQMAPTKRSDQMMACLIESSGDSVEFDGKSILYWPHSARLATVDPAYLAKACMLGYRAKFIVRTAERISAGFPDVLSLARLPEKEALDLLKTLPGIGEYSAQIISPHPGFPLDVWSARIFHEIMFGTTPEKPREVIKAVTSAADMRWGRFKGYVFVYVLHDLPNLQARYGITRPVL